MHYAPTLSRQLSKHLGHQVTVRSASKVDTSTPRCSRSKSGEDSGSRERDGEVQERWTGGTFSVFCAFWVLQRAPQRRPELQRDRADETGLAASKLDT